MGEGLGQKGQEEGAVTRTGRENMVRRGLPDRSCDYSSYWITLLTVEGAGAGVMLQDEGVGRRSRRPTGAVQHKC